MSYRNCLACKTAGTKPKRGAGHVVVYDPTIQMPGTPTLMGRRLGAEFMAVRVWKLGIKEQMQAYDLSREELLVVCWWAGRFGPRRVRKALGAWAEMAGHHLWYSCVNIVDPPIARRSTRRTRSGSTDGARDSG